MPECPCILERDSALVEQSRKDFSFNIFTFSFLSFPFNSSVLFVGMLVPYDSQDLAFATKSKSSAAASPFVVAMKQVAALPHIIKKLPLLSAIQLSQ